MRLALVLLLAFALAGCAEEPGSPSPNPTSPPASTPIPGAATTPAGTPTTTPAASDEEKECVSQTHDARSAHPTWVIETTMGTMRMTLFCDATPITAQNIVALTERGFYDGIKFHRVIRGFMNQGGDPLTKDDSQVARWGTGGSEDIQDEFYCADRTVDHTMNNPQYPGRAQRPGGPHQACDGALGLKHDSAGALSMANAGPNTGSSQFFITAAPQPGLDGAHPVFGHTADQESLDVALAINQVCPCPSDRPNPAIVIERATINWS